MITCTDHPGRLWRRDLLPSSRKRNFPRQKMFQDGLNASVTTVGSTDGAVHVAGWAMGATSLQGSCQTLGHLLLKQLEQRSMTSSTDSGLLPVPISTLYELYPGHKEQQECRMCPMEHPMEGTQPGCPGLGVWGRTSPSPSPSRHRKRQSIPPHPVLGQWDVLSHSCEDPPLIRARSLQQCFLGPSWALCAALSEQRNPQPLLTHPAMSAARAVGIQPGSCCLVLWSMKCNHHYLIAPLSPLGAEPSLPASWLGNHCSQNSSCCFKIQLGCLTWWPFMTGNSSGWCCVNKYFLLFLPNLLAIIDWPLCSCVMGW